MAVKIISKNRKAFHNYEIGDAYEAGIALLGTEVKALRVNKVNLGDGWVDINANGNAVLMETHIGHYSHGNRFNHEEMRPRRLLLHRRELAKLSRAIHEKGLSIVPTKIYFKGRYVKIEIALGKGKKSYDKRQANKTKDANREIHRALKNHR